MHPSWILLIVFLSLAIVVLAIILPLVWAKSKYETFIRCHSVSYLTLQRIKNRYSFIPISNKSLSHSYDNENFYRDISPLDYLTYELVYLRKEAKQACLDALENQKKLKEFEQEFWHYREGGVFDAPFTGRSHNFLLKTEQKLIKRSLPTPATSYSIRVLLILTNIQGQRRTSKSQSFSAPQIMEVIKRLNQKQGSFYTNRDIWDSICRVERGMVTNRMRFAIYQRDGNRCRKCGSRYNLEIDHIIPIAKGGKSTMNNLQTLCHRCNVKKGANIE